ncbi:dihydrolipoamide acetyltransferase family protein [Pseudomonas resinovorans]|uniref:dihydrolipoamide acetyltransferase family protein n=1 Tax=Metapseudomonas resinovorans TaxID=53412 RepID=UPI00237F1AA2|nr:dihydrolipoamide acetyltransferase family protein [Pseudomonas resinovorans]MDE3738921.1 dihydrolipoamide acetyltransferase family protein [Pseudomonas resinovorans]
MIEFKLPSLGADMDQGTLLEWRVKPGDKVRRGQVVAVVDTAKAAVDVECWHDGEVFQLLLEPGGKVPVGTLIATLLETGESAETAPRRPEPEVAAPETNQHPAPTRHKVSPAARRRAGELGIDPDSLSGSGPHGVVSLEDVERAATANTPFDRAAAMRQAIAELMSRSKREIPHYYLSETISLAACLAWLSTYNAAKPPQERLLPAAMLLKAVALALRRHPQFNGCWKNGAFQPTAGTHLGVAIALRQGGLVAPVLQNVAEKGLAQVMFELGDLVARARSGSLRSSELAEAGLTVTQMGDQGAESVFGVIYPPQVALVGFGRIAERPWVEDGKLCVRPTVVASLAADHRASDGHAGARFLAEIEQLLQTPELLGGTNDE